MNINNFNQQERAVAAEFLLQTQQDEQQFKNTNEYKEWHYKHYELPTCTLEFLQHNPEAKEWYMKLMRAYMDFKKVNKSDAAAEYVSALQQSKNNGFISN